MRMQVRFGRIMELLDALAGDVAYHHVTGKAYDDDTKDVALVTAAMDRLNFSRDLDVTQASKGGRELMPMYCIVLLSRVVYCVFYWIALIETFIILYDRFAEVRSKG